MIVTEYARITTLLLLFCTSIKSSHSQRAYDKGDWIPLISSCPTCQSKELTESRKIVKKEATGRVLNIGQDGHPNHLVNNDKFVPFSGDQNFRLEEADSYEDFRNYYNFNTPGQRHQESLQNTDSYVQETSKRQHLLAQKVLEPLFLNQELQPPKSTSVDSQEQRNNLHTSNSKEQSYHNSPRFIQYSNNQLQSSNAGDNIPPVRFNLLQSNIQSTQHSSETPKLENIPKFSGGIDNDDIKSNDNQRDQYSSERHNYSSPPFTNSPTFSEASALVDKKIDGNRSPGTFQFNPQSPLNENTELSNIPNPLSSLAKVSDIRPQGESVAFQLQNRFSESPGIPLLKSFSNSDVNPNFSPPQIRNMIQDVNAGLQPELPQVDKATPSLYQQEITARIHTSKGNAPVEITTPISQPNRESVELLYVPVQYLNKHQEQPKHFSTSEYKPRSSFPQNRQSGILNEPNNHFQKTSAEPFKQAQQMEGIENDFASQALGALKLQQQLHSGEIPITSPPVNNLISSTTKSVKKKKSHQPPLAVYMENDGNVKVTDVLNLLKSSRTITVQDTVGPDTPPVFVGPYDLDTPEGYAKFDLPYLSSLDANQIETKADEFPFFVAPINYRAPEGYSKIPLPSPHVGSIVLSEKKKGTSSKASQNAFAGVPSRDVLEHKQHYRDTLDQPNYQSKLLPSSIETPLSIRQTTDHNDYNQLNNHFLHPNQRIPSPQSKFEEEYNRINNIYRTTPKPEISQFVITTSTSSPPREQQQYVFNPQTGFIEQIPQTQSFTDQQRPVQGNNFLAGSRGELVHSFPSRENPPMGDIPEHRQASTKSQENIPSRSRLSETPKYNVEISTTSRPLRGRFRETNDQTSTKPTRGRGSSHYSSSSYDQGDKHDLERPKTVHRNRGNSAGRNGASTAKIKEEPNQQWQKHIEESSRSTPTILGSRSTPASGSMYNDGGQTHTNNLSSSDKTSSNTYNSVNIPQVPYYDEISDIQPFNQQVPTSLSLKEREEAKKQRTQSVSSLEQNLGIPITSNGASGILSQSTADDSYSDPLLKSTEEPVFEFTTRSQPARSRPSTFESYELDSTHSDESRDFDDFFLTSSEHEEEPKNFRLPSQIHSVNPALPGLINNLQDQSIRSILNPALIVPTTQQSIDEITSSQRLKLPHTETTINNQNSFAKPPLSYQNPQTPRVTENYEINAQQQKHTAIIDTRRNPIQLESLKPEIDRPSALPTNEQQNFNSLQPSESFSMAPQSLSSPTLQSIDSSTHLPTIETTTLAKRGRGRFRSRGPSVSTTTTAPIRRNLHRTRRPLKVESRSENLDHHQTASSTYSPVKLLDRAPNNARHHTINNFGGLGQNHKPQEKSEYYQKVHVIPEYELMPNSSSNHLERQGARINNFYKQPTLKEYVSGTTISAPNSFMSSNGAMSTLPLYQENFKADLPLNQPIMFNRDLLIQDMSHLTAPSANAAEETQSHSSNVQFVHPDDYSNGTLINFIPRSNSQDYEKSEGDHIKAEKVNLENNSQYLNYNTAPSAEAAISETTEATTGRNPERGRVRGRAGTKHVLSTVPITERSKATTLEKPKEENEEFYGFFRSPNFKPVTSPPTTSTSHANTLSITGGDFTGIPQSHFDSSQGRDNSDSYSSTPQSSETVRPRYSSVIRNPTGPNKELESAVTTKQPESTQRSRKRGRTRKPYVNASSNTRINQQTETTYTRRYTTTERPTIRTTQRLRTRGRAHFQSPQSLKGKREDDLETANYPASFLASQGIGMKQSASESIAQTENPNFRITVESGFDADGDLAEYDQLTNPSYISASIVMPDGSKHLINQIDNEGLKKKSMGLLDNFSTTIEPRVVDRTDEKIQNNADSTNSNESNEGSVGMKKRGFWKLVKQKSSSDPLEAAESQHVGSFSANSFNVAEGKPPKKDQGMGTDIENIPQLTKEVEKVVDLLYQNVNDSLHDVSQVTNEHNLNANSDIVPEFDNTVPENSKVTLRTLTTTEGESQNYGKSRIIDNASIEKKYEPSTEIPPRTTNSFEKSMRTLQSTEISHETEICYRGKCIRTSNPTL
ncbi:uncharacterized protein LOC108739365 [Agrilus planipennis]|uniref:Uncharacterized protein LOC108739365 n=1 Tax=Agrilus planipennis TaxID=224129 RepID=A0A1W4X7D5_AGRPL|nr:uncharacterized protein LOC108739365 [Agrilus planipennis]